MSDLGSPSGSTDPVSQSTFIMWRLAQLEHQVAQLDQQGSRGVATLATKVELLAKDFAEHEKQHKESEAAQATARRWTIGIVVGAIIGLVGPLYPLVLLIARSKGGG